MKGIGGSMKKALRNKIQQLGAEAQSLSQVKYGLQKQLGEIDTRLTQIVGAITELEKLEIEIGETDGDAKDATNNQSGVHDSISKTDGNDATDEDSVQAKEAGGGDNGGTEEVRGIAQRASYSPRRKG